MPSVPRLVGRCRNEGAALRAASAVASRRRPRPRPPTARAASSRSGEASRRPSCASLRRRFVASSRPSRSRKAKRRRSDHPPLDREKHMLAATSYVVFVCVSDGDDPKRDTGESMLSSKRDGALEATRRRRILVVLFGMAPEVSHTCFGFDGIRIGTGDGPRPVASGRARERRLAHLRARR